MAKGKSRQPRQLARPGANKPKLPADFRHPSFYPAEEPLTRKRTVAITLGALGMAAIGYAWLGGNDVQRNSYSSLEDCEHDYATGQCTRDQPMATGYATGYH